MSAEITHPSLFPIREAILGFRNERERYLAGLTSADGLPRELQHLQHLLPWPVDMANPRAHITAYFNDLNYSDSDPNKSELHQAIDIQLPRETPIISPIDATVALVDSGFPFNSYRELADIYLYNESLGLTILLVHLDGHTLPEKIARRTYFDKWSEVKVGSGEQIGTVGTFFHEKLRKKSQKYELSPSIQVPEDVEAFFGRTYDHVHFEVHHQPNIYDLGANPHNPVDPIVLLQKLY